MATDFVKPQTSTLTFQVKLDADGNIATDNLQTTKKYKTISLDGFNVDGTYNDADALIDAVIAEMGGAIVDKKSIKKVTVYRLADSLLVEVEFYASDIEEVFSDTYVFSERNTFTAADIDDVFADTYTFSGRNKFTAADMDDVFADTYTFSY